MELKDLQAMPSSDLLKLYNSMAEKQVKRFENRKKAEERTAQLLRDNGKLDSPMTTGEARNIAETAKAGTNTGTPLRKLDPKKAAKKEKAKPAPAAPSGKPKEKAEKAAPAKGEGKAAGKTAKAHSRPADVAGEAKAKKRGAPTKNPTYIALSEKAKGYNPKGFRTNSTSARFKVLDFIRTDKDDGKTREDIEAHFANDDVNVTSSLYFLAKYGFVKVSD